MSVENVAKDLLEVLEKKKTPSAFDTSATVVRVEDDTLWVHIPGGVEATPVKRTVGASVGDNIQIRVGGGTAWAVGNASAPPTDDTRANVAVGLAETALADAESARNAAIIAQTSADSATASAEIAATAAEQAIEDAATADAKAVEAQTSANNAASAASAAQTSANNAASAANVAQTSANTANSAANSALTQLSTVEDVVGTLNWISQHGTYVVTSDTEVVDGKLYFIRTTEEENSGHILISSDALTVTDNDGALTINAQGNITFSDDGQGNVSVSNLEYEESETHYVYSVVTNPTGNPSALGYYELDSIDEAVSNYVATHLALTDDGLYVISDENGWRVLIKNDGVYIVDNNGDIVAQYKSAVTIGKKDLSYIRLTDKSFQMVDREDNVFFDVSDFRDENGEFSLTERFIGNGTLRVYQLKYSINALLSVGVDGTTLDSSDYTVGSRAITFVTTPQADSEIVIRYKTADSSFKAYTFGFRNLEYIYTYSSDTEVIPGKTYYGMGIDEGGEVVYYDVATGEYVTRTEESHIVYSKITNPTGNPHENIYFERTGFSVDSIGLLSVAEGDHTSARGKASHAEGSSTRANNNYSHAEGLGTQANGLASHAEGQSSKASGESSHSEGNETTASGNYSHAEGRQTIASGFASHAEGASSIGYFSQNYLIAAGDYSHAEGLITQANGDYSHAEGYKTIANGEAQHVFGSHNIEDLNDEYVEIVGNGKYIIDEQTPSASYWTYSNARTLDWDGNEWLAGDLTINGSTSVGTALSNINVTLGNSLVNRVTLTSSDDLDNITTPGIYYVSTEQPANMPANLSYCAIFVWQTNGTSDGACQLLMQGSTLSTEYRRRKYGNPAIWQSWEKRPSKAEIDALIEATNDSDWQTLSLGSAFELYTAGADVKYRKVCGVVEVRGVIKPTSQIAAGGTAVIGTLPTGYRPDTTRYFVCHGSGQNIWLLVINSSGVMSLERYGGDSTVVVPTTAWLPFNATFLAE